jgi:aminopeptidase N/puromycin-sensitive aminopeptidase
MTNFPLSRRALLAAALVCASFLPASSARAQRLPTNAIPLSYSLSLTPDLKAATYTGSETIDVSLADPATSVTLNAIEITFQSVKITARGKEQTATVTLDKDKEQATFTVPDSIPAGLATISIQFTGILNNELRGFYLSKTSRRNYAVTQFEPTDARRAFPCFDEPGFKATFDVTLVVDKGDTAISNSPIAADTPGPAPGKHSIKFDTTPRMSTYLVAFLVGDFQCSSGEQDSVAIRVCSTPDKVALTAYSVDIAKYVLHYYNQYFGIPYPLKKLDLIGLPDFEAGAMENFGAITYRETALLLDPTTASVGAKKQVALVIAHEMAHQWFGDLVTMQWWDNIWLNEGFASWMENKPIEEMHPEWNIDLSVVSDLDNTLNLDAQPTTRAIRAKADTPDEINQMFDGITYNKAAAVLLMIENYLGADVFRQGVHNYLSAHLYGNATAEDFWGAQTRTSRKLVDKIMESLVAQPGAPVLAFGKPANGSVDVAQSRFFLSPSIKPDPEQKWTLPVCFKTTAGPQNCEFLTPGSHSLPVPASAIFFANANGKGYYRASYEPDTYKTILSQVETGLTPAERIHLIGDQWAQLRANKATVGDYLSLVSAVKDDTSAEVNSSAIEGVDAIYLRVAATKDERDKLAAWIRATYGPHLAALGAPAPDDTPNTRELRSELFRVLGEYGKDPNVIAYARQLAEKYIADPGSVDATLAQTAVNIAARNGDSALFDKLLNVYETATNPELQDGALRMLALFEDPALETRALDLAASSKVRNQDAAFQFAIAIGNDGTRDQAWKYVKTNWDKVKAQFTTQMGSAVVGSTSSFCSADAREDVEKFFADHKVTASSTTLKHAIERINGCIELRQLQQGNLDKWLATHGG